MRGRADVLLSSQGLMTIRSKARRTGIWFEALTNAERAIVDLTIKCVEKVRSPILARTINKIISKIAKTLEGFMEKAIRIGGNLAKQIVQIAQKWGNKEAPHWKNDAEFITFLGVTALNT